MKKGIYLITEPGCMNPTSGAYQHVRIGKKMLSRHFIMQYCMLFDELRTTDESTPVGIRAERETASNFFLKRTPFVGGLRDIYLFIKQNSGIIKSYKKIKRCNPDFIYERTSFLDFRGLIVARLLRIPHFYENNGIAALAQHKYFYPSFLHNLTLWIEKFAYSKTNFIFYVGTWGNFFNSSKRNWKNVENGIEKEILSQNKCFIRDAGENITIAFIGRLMKHHNIPLLLDALRKVPSVSRIKLLLLGAGLEETAEQAASFMKCEYIGYIPRSEIIKYLRQIDIGIIPGSEEYPSHMKIFDYAASKALVICPDTSNLKYWFSDEEVYFFRKDSVNSLVSAIEKAVNSPPLRKSMGNALYNKVSAKFTWDHVFDQKADIIKSILKKIG